MMDLHDKNLVFLPSSTTIVTCYYRNSWLYSFIVEILGCILSYYRKSRIFVYSFTRWSFMVHLWYVHSGIILCLNDMLIMKVRSLWVFGYSWYRWVIIGESIEVMWLSRQVWSLILLLFISEFILVDLCDGDYVCVRCRGNGKRPGRGRGDPKFWLRWEKGTEIGELPLDCQIL